MLLRYLIWEILDSAYDWRRDHAVLNHSLREVTDRLNMKDLKELFKFMTNEASTDEMYNKVTDKVFRAQSKAKKKEHEMKKGEIEAGYVLWWMRTKGTIQDEELKYFPNLGKFLMHVNVDESDKDESRLGDQILDDVSSSPLVNRLNFIDPLLAEFNFVNPDANLLGALEDKVGIHRALWFNSEYYNRWESISDNLTGIVSNSPVREEKGPNQAFIEIIERWTQAHQFEFDKGELEKSLRVGKEKKNSTY